MIVRTAFASSLPATIEAPRLLSRVDTTGWLLSFFSFLMLILMQWSSRFPGAAFVVGLLYMLPWGLVVLRRPSAALAGVAANWPLLLLPLLALASAIWSDYFEWTLRAGTQYLATVVIGIVAGTCLKPKALFSSLLCALGLVTLLSVLYGSVGGAGNGELALIGLFGSKNYFASTVCFLVLVAIPVAFERSQPLILRAIGFAGLAAAPLLLGYAKSAGAIVDLVATCAIVAMLYFMARLSPLVRVSGFSFLAFIALILIVTGLLFVDQAPDILNYMGKDVTLTGRTYLWQRALESIWQQPLFGVGYQAFWQIGNWAAEDLWLQSGVAAKAGYHFHDLYLQVGVDLGLAGLAILVSMLLVMLVRAIAVASGSPRREQMFAISAFVFMLLRTPIEVESFYQFDLSTMTFCLNWIYLRSGRPGRDSG